MQVGPKLVYAVNPTLFGIYVTVNTQVVLLRLFSNVVCPVAEAAHKAFKYWRISIHLVAGAMHNSAN